MLGVTTDSIPFKITRTIGFVKGTGISAAFMRLNDNDVSSASNSAISEMLVFARDKGANAILGINIAITADHNSIFVIATGTAVVYDPNQPI